MHRTLFILTLVALAVRLVLADQSASFRCQATQGFAWGGRGQVTVEKVDITILPDHVDVEHEFEIAARSDWGSPSYPQSLEILGDLYFGKGTVITGLLLWNGNTILKGKLQTKEMARRKYEAVVDRNVKDPPPPRDPAILEKTGETSYALSIFPVSLNASRKIRIRYLIPSSFRDGAHRIAFPHAFSELAKVTVRGGPGLPGYALTSLRMDGSIATVKNEESATTPVTLDPEAYKHFRPKLLWMYETGAWLRDITPLFSSTEGSRLSIGSMRDSRGSAGHVAHFIFRPPADFVDSSSAPGTRIVAIITAGTDTVKKEIYGGSPGPKDAEEIRIYSQAPLESDIIWRIYTNNKVTREKTEKPAIIRYEDGKQFARILGGTPFYPIAKSMPVSLAAAWGFIDSRYALLALEQDSLRTAVAEQYRNAGVPSLNSDDIYPESGHLDSIPLSAWSLQRNFNRDDLLQPIAIAATGLPAGIRWRFQDGRVIVEIDKASLARGLRISLHGLDGKLLKEWNAKDASEGRLDWSPRDGAYAGGICMLRVISGSQAFSVRVLLR